MPILGHIYFVDRSAMPKVTCQHKLIFMQHFWDSFLKGFLHCIYTKKLTSYNQSPRHPNLPIFLKHTLEYFFRKISISSISIMGPPPLRLACFLTLLTASVVGLVPFKTEEI